MACAGGRVALGQCDPILAPGPKRPWLFCVGESGFLCGDDLGFEHRGYEACQAPWIFPLYEESFREIILRATLASGEWEGQRGQDLNILDNTGLFAMVLTAILPYMKDNHHG